MSTQTSDQRHAAASARIDARGPQFTAARHRGRAGRRAVAAHARRDGADRRPGGAVRASGRAAGVQHTPTAWAVPPLRPAPAAGHHRVRGPAAAALRPGGGPGLRAGRRSSASRPACSRWPWWRPGSRSSPPCSTPCSASAWAARCTCSSSASPPDPKSPEGKRDHMSRDTTLVSAQWVEDHLDDDDVVLVEVDEDTSAYDKGHIRGAIKLDWTTDLQDQVRRDFVNSEQFSALLSERGVSNDDTVVLYGGNNNWFAAYAYWYFKLYGHDDVKLLDGGRKKWELDSRELTDEPPKREQDVVPGPGPGPLDPRLPRRDRRGHRHPEPRRRPQPRRVRRPAARPGPPPAGAGPARRAHPDRGQRPVEQGGQRRRHLQVRRRAEADLHRGRRRLEQGHHRLLPDRRALEPHLVRPQGAARPAERQELRRLVDRVRLAGRRAGRDRRREG